VEQLRGDFIATVSHELRTPLTPLRGFLGVLREHGNALDEDRRSMMIEAMENQVTRLSDLIGDLLQVAEVDAGVVEVQPRLLDVTSTIREVVALRPEGQQHRIQTALRPATAVADPVALRRIVEALVSNACKHTDGPTVVSTSRRAGRVVVAVDDEGPGIAPADRATVFQPFRRLGDHLHRTQGPGVGLAVARALAHAQDATLEIVDKDGAGTRFELVLPGAVRALRSASTDEVDRVG
jgi:two-component system sensor histidine kinase KdpD